MSASPPICKHAQDTNRAQTLTAEVSRKLADSTRNVTTACYSNQTVILRPALNFSRLMMPVSSKSKTLKDDSKN